MFMMRPLMLGAGLLSALRPQDVFATSLYTGTGAAQTITTGLDFTTAGGLNWFKTRNAGIDHVLLDTQRPLNALLSSSLAQAEQSYSYLTGRTATGVILSTDTGVNGAGTAHALWSFRRAPKFFDIVTYTGDGTSGRVIPHGLGIKPGMILVKSRNIANPWVVYHASMGATKYGLLTTDAFFTAPEPWNNTEPTATGFTLGPAGGTNQLGATYVAYIFAHDPDTTNGIVQCGSVPAGGAATLGWQPQWLVAKLATAGPANWVMLDTARGWGAGGDGYLAPNTAGADSSLDFGAPTATGFTTNANFGGTAGVDTLVYCAIRAPIN